MTTVLTRGGNAPLAASVTPIAFSWIAEASLDVSLLLLSDGKVRSDADFVFYNQPSHTSGAASLTDDRPGRARLQVDLGRVEEAVDRILVCASLHSGTTDQVEKMCLNVADLTYPLVGIEPVAALIVGEFYRRGTDWKFRAIGQGYPGLADLAREYGIAVEDDDADLAPDKVDTVAPVVATQPVSSGASSRDVPLQRDSDQCQRCGAALKKRRFSGRNGAWAPCRACERQIAQFMAQWQGEAQQVLHATGPVGHGWDALWGRFADQQVDEANGWLAIEAAGLHYLEREVAFAFADGIIEQGEMESFDRHAAALRLTGHGNVAAMRKRMADGLAMNLIRTGNLPNVLDHGLHLDAGELVHLAVDAMFIKFLAAGPREVPGRLIASNKKLRFLTASGTGGSEVSWSKVVAVAPERGGVAVSATSAKGGGLYRVADADYAEAVLSGTLRVAKRLVLAPGARDSRSIPQHVRSEVWQRDGGKCCECSATSYLEYDHIIPWSEGGATSVANLQLLCRGCNSKKGARI